MADLMVSALRLTILGMGMTFLSIGALVAGMFLLTRLTTHRGSEGEQQMVGLGVENSSGEEGPSGMPGSDPEGGWGDEEGRRRAVAAAVAVSLALRAGSDHAPAPSLSALSPGTRVREETPWNAYARGLRLSARSRYESLRGRQ